MNHRNKPGRWMLLTAFMSGAAVLLWAVPARAQSVAMTGSMGSKVLLVVNGGAPRALGRGDTHKGVKVIKAGSDEAVVEIDGKRQTVRLGAAPVSIGSAGSAGSGGTAIVLTAGSGGHFMTQGSINGRSVDFMVDTGATTVAMGADEARRIGLKYQHGQRTQSHTANGIAQGYLVTLNNVRIKDVVVHNVEAHVLEGSMPFILLGNSFLTRFQMRRENDQMTLVKRF